MCNSRDLSLRNRVSNELTTVRYQIWAMFRANPFFKYVLPVLYVCWATLVLSGQYSRIWSLKTSLASHFSQAWPCYWLDTLWAMRWGV